MCSPKHQNCGSDESRQKFYGSSCCSRLLWDMMAGKKGIFFLYALKIMLSSDWCFSCQGTMLWFLRGPVWYILPSHITSSGCCRSWVDSYTLLISKYCFSMIAIISQFFPMVLFLKWVLSQQQLLVYQELGTSYLHVV